MVPSLPNRLPQPWVLVLDVDSLVSVTADAARRIVAAATGPEASALRGDAAVAAAREAWDAAQELQGRGGPPFDEETVRLHERLDLGNTFLVLVAVAVAQSRECAPSGSLEPTLWLACPPSVSSPALPPSDTPLPLRLCQQPRPHGSQPMTAARCPCRPT